MNKALKYTGLILFTLFFIIPVALTLSQSDAEEIRYVFTNSYFKRVMLFTLFQALLSSLLSVLAGLPGAWLIKNRKFAAKKFVTNVYLIPYVLPSVLVVLGFVAVYGNNGLISKIFGIKPDFLYSFKAVLAAHVFYNFPVAVNIISACWLSLDSDTEDFALSTGASKLKVFVKITLPRLMPSIASALTLIFLMCFNSFAIIMVLGGKPELTTTEVEIYRQAAISLNTSRASALVIFSLICSTTVLLLYSLFDRKTVSERALKKDDAFKKPGFLGYLYLVISVTFILLPLAGILIKALNLQNFKIILSDIQAILNTVALAICSSVLGTVLALSIASYLSQEKHLKIFDFASMLSLSVSSVIIGLSYFVVSRYFNFIPKFVLLVISHSMISMPFCLKTILPGFRKLPLSVIENAKSLGASPFSLLKEVKLRALREEIATSLVFGFAISCGEFNSTIMLASSTYKTLPVEIYRLTASYNYSGACALGLVLALICFIANSVKLKILDV